MRSRLELRSDLRKYVDNTYFQPPANTQLVYPCIIYRKITNTKWYADDSKYHKIQGYTLTVIDNNPDSEIADLIESDFDYCTIEQRYVVDNLHHTTLNLYY